MFFRTTSLVTWGLFWANTGAASSSAHIAIRLIFFSLICNPVDNDVRVGCLELDGQRLPVSRGQQHRFAPRTRPVRFGGQGARRRSARPRAPPRGRFSAPPSRRGGPTTSPDNLGILPGAVRPPPRRS